MNKICHGTSKDVVEKAWQAEKETKKQQEKQKKILNKFQNGTQESSKKLCDHWFTKV